MAEMLQGGRKTFFFFLVRVDFGRRQLKHIVVPITLILEPCIGFVYRFCAKMLFTWASAGNYRLGQFVATWLL